MPTIFFKDWLPLTAGLLRAATVGSEGNAALEKDGADDLEGFALVSDVMREVIAEPAAAAEAAEVDDQGVERCTCRYAGACTMVDEPANAGNRSTAEVEGPACAPETRGGKAPAA